ncbi:MAG: DUF6438 domain-containing protein [Bacteroidota bacterium]|nr:DUF6438 domain-containing protein [Bacteroidota bacterium]
MLSFYLNIGLKLKLDIKELLDCIKVVYTMENFFKFISIKYYGMISCWLFLFFLLYMTPTFAQDVTNEEPIPEDAIIYMERTQCYGSCPVYSYHIFENGKAQYLAKENVEKIGTFYTILSEEKMEALIDMFYRYEFFEFENRYVDLITDLPTTYIYFSHNGLEKKITDYHGAPVQLKNLEKEVDEFMQSLEWEKIEE